jgi:hypothetical protein
MSAIAELIELLSKKSKQLTPVQTVWAICKSVDWDNKKMVATGQTDSLDYEDVLLGKGFEFKKPKLGTICLLGIIQNSEAMTFLIDAEEIEEYLITDATGFKLHLKDGKISMNGETFGGIVKAAELKTQVDKNTLAIQTLQNILSSWTPVPNDGGASLKSLITAFVSKPLADLNNIENTTINHGNDV